MHYYSSNFEDYVQSVKKYNIHPELEKIWNCMIKNDSITPSSLPNLIFYGPSGVGKYSQVLYFISKMYSTNSHFTTKKMSAQLNKQTYFYHVSDIHFEIDMGLLGCNSKLLWNEIFTQIVDIVNTRGDKKMGIVVCKNFHCIHTELLEIFYSYIQQFNTPSTLVGGGNIFLRFFLLTENISFIPTNIINNCYIVRISRPLNESYKKLLYMENENNTTNIIENTTESINSNTIENIKDFLSYGTIVLRAKENEDISPVAKKSMYIICNEIIRQMKDYKKLSFLSFRDAIYDIFIYNLDVAECVWYIVIHFIKDLENVKKIRSVQVRGRGRPSRNAGLNEKVDKKWISKSSSAILKKLFSFFKYYNNNYRPIYHLESLFIHIITVFNDEF